MGRAKDLIAKLATDGNFLSRIDRAELQIGGRSLPTSRIWTGTIPGSSPFDMSDIADPSGIERVSNFGIPSKMPLSILSPDMGLIQAGEFRTGNGAEPGEGFSGVRIGYPAFTYSSIDWNIVGINNDVVQFGLRSSDGVALAGGGNVLLSSAGITLALTTSYFVPNSIKWINTAITYIDVAGSYAGPSGQHAGILDIKTYQESATLTTPDMVRFYAGHVEVNQSAQTNPGYQMQAWNVTSGAHLQMVTGTEYPVVHFDLSAVAEFETGAITTERAFRISAPTLGFVGASTISDVTTFYIDKAPVAGTNATFTRSYAIWVDAGDVRLDGDLDVRGGDFTTDQTTFNLLNATATTINLGGAATAINIAGAAEIRVGTTTDFSAIGIGIGIDQGSGSGAILQFKSSDIAHGMTTQNETSVYGTFYKGDATLGGLYIRGLTEDIYGIVLESFYTTSTTTKSTGALGAYLIQASKKSVATVGAMGANDNIIAFRNNGTTRFILDADGDSHQDVGTAWTNFDTHDDLYLLNLLSAHVTREDDPLKETFGKWLADKKDVLENLGIVTFNDDLDGHAFINWSRTKMLMIGALRQVGDKIYDMEQRMNWLERQVLALGGQSYPTLA